jgi:choline dehydrogenase/4-pyridoxate dehydrogenase
MEYDYIIVGAGSAGCTLAHRLSEDWQRHVLVLEAGEWSDDLWIKLPLGWGRILQKRLHDWQYFAEPEESVGNRPVECARGKVVGGSSSINAMAYVRGHRSDYDRWAASGLPGWSYAHALPYFKRQETWEGGETAYRGGSGPLYSRVSRYADPLIDAMIEAAVAAGHRRNADYNGAEQEGFGRLQSNIRKGERWSGTSAYLKPAVARGNVTVETGAHVTRVLFEGAAAVGVEYVKNGEKKIARAGREVLLCGGVINTPQVLMLSGIGAPDELRSHGIEVKLPHAGVGKNLQDHISAAIAYSRREPGPFVKNLRLDRLALALAQAKLLGTGFATDLPSGVMGFYRTKYATAAPDVQMLFHAGPLSAEPYFPPFKAPPADGFGARAVLLRPESRGSVRLASSDPLAPVRIHQNFFAADRDREVLREGMRILRDVTRRAPMAPFAGKEVLQDFSDAGLDAYFKATAITAHHPLGTCKMGRAGDPAAVVDEELRVFGAERLRVVDASVMPDLVGGNINAPVVMIAEKAADLIRGKPVLPPAQL